MSQNQTLHKITKKNFSDKNHLSALKKIKTFHVRKIKNLKISFKTF